MDSFNPTTKTQQAISAAVQAASLAGNPDVGPTHLLGALLAQGDGIAAPLLAAVGADPAAVRTEVTALGNRLPSASGSTVGAVNFPQVALPARSTGTRFMHVHRNAPGVLGNDTDIDRDPIDFLSFTDIRDRLRQLGRPAASQACGRL